MQPDPELATGLSAEAEFERRRAEPGCATALASLHVALQARFNPMEESMQPNREWATGPDAWAEFVAQHPELGYRPGKWQFHNFLRYFRATLVERDAIRLARRRFWVAHRARFNRACFDLATGASAPNGAEHNVECSLAAPARAGLGHA